MRTLLSITLVLVALSLSACKGGSSKISASVNGGDTQATISSKIINGLPVDQSLSPQIVQVNVYFADGSTALCSGTSIAPEYFLTAAHCFNETVVATSVVVAGTEIFGDSVTTHPDYFVNLEVNALFNDVAVLHVPGLNIPALAILSTVPVAEGASLFTYGYGLDENAESGTLKNGPVSILFSTENHLFSEAFDGSNVDPCNGDSGGPAVLGFTDVNGTFAVGIAGIVSSGTVEGCAKGDMTLFTNLQNPAIAEFIRSAAPGAVFN
jgi:secreted trypsin-like serine protease